MSSSASPGLRFGDFELDLQSGELRNNGQITRLPEQLFRILVLLLQRRGEVVTRDELRQNLWSADTFVDFDTGLNTAMSKLRDVLGDSAENPKFIQTLPRRGYRMVAPVAEVPPVVDTAPARRVTHRTYWAVGVVIAVLVLLVGERALRRPQPAPPAPRRIESIAVLPLENLSGDPEQEHFADGMTDVLITDLAQIEGLRVISRTSVMPYKKARKSLRDIARELNVDGIVEGTVTRSGSRVRITAQLIDASTDRHLWAKSYERDVIDILPLQGQVAQAIADAVEVKIAPQVRARLRSAPRLNPDAYDAFFKGLVALSQVNAAGVARAVKHFERAVTIQPDFALAHASLAKSHYQYAFFGPLSPRDFMPKAETAARNALKIDPAITEAHLTLANILYRYHWDWTAADAEFRSALELAPNDGATHAYYSTFLFARGRDDEAVAQFEIARKLDPRGANDGARSPQDFARIAAAARSNVKRSPSTRGWFQLGSALAMNGQFREAINALESSEPERNARYLAYLGYAYGKAGNEEKAREILDRLITLSGKQYVSSVMIALVHTGLGEKQAAIERLERAYDERAFELSHVNVTPPFDSLRSEPRFRNLLQRIGLPAVTA